MPIKRSPRSIRFSDDEWTAIADAADRLDMPAAEFVRKAAAAVALGDPGPQGPRLTPELLELIKHTFRYAYFSASVKRDELQRDGRRVDIDQAVELARKAQHEVLSGAGELPPAGEKP